MSAADAVALVTAMFAGPDDVVVQREGCSALACAVADDEARQAVLAAVAVGGPAAVVAAIRRHAGDAELQSHGCLALARIATSGTAARHSVVAAGGLAAVVAAMGRHASNAQVQGNGCLALARILY